MNIPPQNAMSELKPDLESDLEQNYSMNSNVDPKNMQELTIYVSFAERVRPSASECQ